MFGLRAWRKPSSTSTAAPPGAPVVAPVAPAPAKASRLDALLKEFDAWSSQLQKLSSAVAIARDATEGCAAALLGVAEAITPVAGTQGLPGPAAELLSAATSFADDVVPTVVRALRVLLGAPLAAIAKSHEELRARVEERARAEVEYSAAVRSLGSLQRKRDTAGSSRRRVVVAALGGKSMAALVGGSGGSGVGIGSGDGGGGGGGGSSSNRAGGSSSSASQAKIVQRLLSSQALLNALEGGLEEELEALAHRRRLIVSHLFQGLASSMFSLGFGAAGAFAGCDAAAEVASHCAATTSATVGGVLATHTAPAISRAPSASPLPSPDASLMTTAVTAAATAALARLRSLAHSSEQLSSSSGGGGGGGGNETNGTMAVTLASVVSEVVSGGGGSGGATAVTAAGGGSAGAWWDEGGASRAKARAGAAARRLAHRRALEVNLPRDVPLLLLQQVAPLSCSSSSSDSPVDSISAGVSVGPSSAVASVLLASPALWLPRVLRGLPLSSTIPLARVCKSWAHALLQCPGVLGAGMVHGGLVASPCNESKMRIALWVRACGVSPPSSSGSPVDNTQSSSPPPWSAWSAPLIIHPPSPPLIISRGAAGAEEDAWGTRNAIDGFAALLSLARAEGAMGSKGASAPSSSAAAGGGDGGHVGCDEYDVHGGGSSDDGCGSSSGARWMSLIEQDVVRSYSDAVPFGSAGALRRGKVRVVSPWQRTAVAGLIHGDEAATRRLRAEALARCSQQRVRTVRDSSPRRLSLPCLNLHHLFTPPDENNTASTRESVMSLTTFLGGEGVEGSVDRTDSAPLSPPWLSSSSVIRGGLETTLSSPRGGVEVGGSSTLLSSDASLPTLLPPELVLGGAVSAVSSTSAQHATQLMPSPRHRRASAFADPLGLPSHTSPTSDDPPPPSPLIATDGGSVDSPLPPPPSHHTTSRRAALSAILLAVAASSPGLRYTQGMHAIARMLLETSCEATERGPKGAAAAAAAAAASAAASVWSSGDDGPIVPSRFEIAGVPPHLVPPTIRAFALFRALLFTGGGGARGVPVAAVLAPSSGASPPLLASPPLSLAAWHAMGHPSPPPPPAPPHSRCPLCDSSALHLGSLFNPSMLALQLRLYQLDRLTLRRAPELHAHLLSIGATPAAYASPWLLTLFGGFTALDARAVTRLWDNLLLGSGACALFSACLAVLGALQPLLLGAPLEDALPVLAAPRLYYAAAARAVAEEEGSGGGAAPSVIVSPFRGGAGVWAGEGGAYDERCAMDALVNAALASDACRVTGAELAELAENHSAYGAFAMG